MKFSVLIALVGAATASRYGQNGPASCGSAPAQPEPEAEYSCDGQAPLRGHSLRGSLNAAARLASPAAGDADGSIGYGTLSAENAASSTTIGASQVAIPDKNIITDQAKVNEAVSRGSRKSQTCQVAQRKFSINGDITVTEKYNDSLKGDNNSESCGQGASQTRSRTQLLSAGGSAQIPVTTQCAARCPAPRPQPAPCSSAY